MRVDSRLDQFTALIEQQRMRQPALARANQAPRTQSPDKQNSFRSASARSTYSDMAEQARAAMAARNPALAARLEKARAAQSFSTVRPAAELKSSQAITASGATSRSARPGTAPVTNDLLAIPKRPAPAPGLGSTIDTYA